MTMNSDMKDFEIEKGKLIKYKGSGGDVTIPEDVTSIGEGAFQECCDLTSVTIPESVTSIGERAFKDCYDLTSVTIPESVTSIGERAFEICYNLTSVTIPESVTSIGKEAFAFCDNLTSVIFPKSVTYIGEGAFHDCCSLTSVTIPEGVTSIEDETFDDCKSLTRVIIPKGVTSIGDSAFSGCESLTSVTIPEGVTSIGNHAFSGCKSLTSVAIPESVMVIGEGAFFRCRGLADQDGFVIVRDVLYFYCGSGGDVSIPEGVTCIGNHAFSGCKSLTSVTIPKMTSVDIRAFYRCDRLRELIFYSSYLMRLFYQIAENMYLIYLGGPIAYLGAKEYGIKAANGLIYALERGIKDADQRREENLGFIKNNYLEIIEAAKDKKLVVLFLIREKLLDKLGTIVLLKRYEDSDDVEVKAALEQYQKEQFGTGGTGDDFFWITH